MTHSKTKVTKNTTSTRTIAQITFDHALDSYTHNLLRDFEKFTLNRLKKKKLLCKQLLVYEKDIFICYSKEDRETVRTLIEERRKDINLICESELL
jgi:hypothetical protein